MRTSGAGLKVLVVDDYPDADARALVAAIRAAGVRPVVRNPTDSRGPANRTSSDPR